MPNTYVNKVQLADGTSIIDITDTTATASDVAQGKYFYTASGEKVQGTGTGTGGGVTQDQDGYIILPSTGGGNPTLITKSITQNGTYDAEDDDADGYSSVTVSVSGGGGLVYETGTWTPSEDIARGTISFTNTHTTAPAIVEITDVDTSSATPANSNISMMYYNVYTLYGGSFYFNSGSIRYGVVEYLYFGSSQSISTGRQYMGATSGSSSTTTPGYWADSTAFYPYSNSDSRYWRSDRTYKWTAVWAPTT